MENEILEFIDDVRTQYPEIVDDEPIINESVKDIIVSDLPVSALSENRIKNNNDINMIGGIDHENKSDVLISGSDAVNNIRSAESINIDSDLSNFDSTLLYNNSSPTSNQSSGNITLLQDYSNFDFLCFNFRRSKIYNESISIIVNKNEFINSSHAIKPCSFVVNNLNGSTSYRYLQSIDNNYSTIYNYASSSGENILVSIYGLNKKQIVESEPEQPTTSGNTIINNYYGCVSDNSLSYNLLNKPLNSYTVSESMGLYMFCIMGFVAIGLLIKKTIFRER